MCKKEIDLQAKVGPESVENTCIADMLMSCPVYETSPMLGRWFVPLSDLLHLNVDGKLKVFPSTSLQSSYVAVLVGFEALD
jgi:hypothetical protein